MRKPLVLLVIALLLGGVTGTAAEAYHRDTTADAHHPDALLPAGDWKLAWSDEFSGDTLDADKWTTWTDSYKDECRGNPKDNKIDYNLPANVKVSGGHLTITAKREKYTSGSGTAYPWTAGLITTGHACGHRPPDGIRLRQGDYLHERAKLPGEVGMWPSLWTWSDEVDAYEYHPDHPTKLELTNHTTTPMGARTYDAGVKLSADWHDFGVYLGADKVVWYLDGREIFSAPGGFPAKGAHLIVSLSVSNGRHHPAPAPTTNRAELIVENVRVYRQDH